MLPYITGALIHGRPRIGKAYAIESIRRDLERRHPRLSIYKMRCTRSQTPSENSFFSALLHVANHPAQNGASKAALRGRLLHKLRQVADKKGDDQVVLFTDEAQNLHEIQYEWLGEVQIGVTGKTPDDAVMVDNGRPFFQSWCMHESIRRRGSKAV